MTEIERINDEIRALPVHEQIRLAAELLEAKRPELAHAILDRVTTELGAWLALRKLREMESKR
jgi:hypothetical protein